MQTFLPYASYAASARCLDRQRLSKQRVEGYQILRTLLGISSGWRQHPAVRMWIGHEESLGQYVQCCITEWKRRGYTNNIILPLKIPMVAKHPDWLGEPRLHSSHRSNLLRKLPTHYRQYGWTDDPAAPYWWPTQENSNA